MPWVLMAIFTLVQVLGNVYSSYKYILLNSPENLRYFKEPIFTMSATMTVTVPVLLSLHSITTVSAVSRVTENN